MAAEVCDVKETSQLGRKTEVTDDPEMQSQGQKRQLPCVQVHLLSQSGCRKRIKSRAGWGRWGWELEF